MASRKETPLRAGGHATKGNKPRPKSIRNAVIPSANDNTKPAPTSMKPWLDEVRTGLPFASLEQLRGRVGLTQSQIAALLGIPERTIARRKLEERLTPAESDRVDRTSRIFKLTTEVLEGEEKAREWLQRPNRGLGGVTPLSLLDTDRGTRAVEDVLMRIEHGMYG